MKTIELDIKEIKVRCETCGTNGFVLGSFVAGVVGAIDEATRLGKDHERKLPYHIVRLIKPRENNKDTVPPLSHSEAVKPPK